MLKVLCPWRSIRSFSHDVETTYIRNTLFSFEPSFSSKTYKSTIFWFRINLHGYIEGGMRDASGAWENIYTFAHKVVGNRRDLFEQFDSICRNRGFYLI